MKLTTTQQKLVELMQQGHKLMWFGDNGPELEGTPFWPQKGTVRSLIRRGVLEWGPANNRTQEQAGIFPLVLTEGMIYLASPYTHLDHDVMEQRFDAACRAAGHLMSQGHVVFSPIAHTHPIAVRCKLPRGWEFWEQFDREFVLASKKLIVLQLEGWGESKGVAAEVRMAEESGIPVEYMEWSE